MDTPAQPTDIEILIIEDNPSELELTMYALKKHHLANRMIVLRDGAEVLNFLFGKEDGSGPSHRLKLILLDLKLPKVNGIEVLRRIKSDPRTKNIPVVVMTSSRHDQDLQECYKLGVNSYLVKPVNFDQFTETIRQVGNYWLLLNNGYER